ncbi:class I SAM-dependent methyltransferase [Chromatiaceae bacterium AAb-1]|nr:class I SAM-dependent methyltransferase [Chromatiaceae bacterium AAb-1]
MTIALLQDASLPENYRAELCQRFNLALTNQPQSWHLVWCNNALVLRNQALPKQGDILVDFAGGAASYRRLHGGGKGEGIAKATGLNKVSDIRVLDATAGLGRDAFVLASLGARVTLAERNPAVAALLYDGLRRAAIDPALAGWLPQRMQLVFSPAGTVLQQPDDIDVVYLDPMFPPREKSALVKKEMRAFHEVVGEDPDADALLQPALALAKRRVVVKRPGYAGYLAGVKPDMSVTGKNNRFDVYIKAAMM